MAYQVTTERQHLPRSGVALGGLGCGWFELRQDGAFANWNLFNNRPLGIGPHFTWDPRNVLFFVVRCHPHGGQPRLYLLQLEASHGAGGLEGHEHQYTFPWMTGMDRIDYAATVPFVKLDYTHADLPLAISLCAWSPLIPRDVKHSALPLAFFDFTLRAATDMPMDVTILGTLRNCVGYDVIRKRWVNRAVTGTGYCAVEMTADGMDPAHGSFGSLALASCHADSQYYLGWEHLHPYYERLLRARTMPDFDDTPGRNVPDQATGERLAMERCFSSIGRTVTLAGCDATLAHSFAFTWDFPNRYARLLGDRDQGPAGYLEAAATATVATAAAPRPLEGHYYRNFFSSAVAVADYAVQQRAWLESETRRFHDAFYAATLPPYVLDTVNAQLNTLRTSSWLTLAGDFGILEGLSPVKSYAGLATVDVAMYGQLTTAALFPTLDQAVIRAHQRLQFPSGIICHSINLNFQAADPREGNGHRIDLPAQYAWLALRAAAWTDDEAFLREIWPSVQRALEYVLRERDANGDALPDMAGIMCSYDNFPMYGVAPYVATQWLAALTAAVAAAQRLGDTASATRYAAILQRGTAVLEEQTWNGRYYRLYRRPGAAPEPAGEGCLTDQILGHWACHLGDLPPFLTAAHVQPALRAILAMNYHPEQGLRNCQWPGDSFLRDVTPTAGWIRPTPAGRVSSWPLPRCSSTKAW